MLTSSDHSKEVSFVRRSAQSFVFHAKAFQWCLDSRRHYDISREMLISKFLELEQEYLHLRSVVDNFGTSEFYDDGFE